MKADRCHHGNSPQSDKDNRYQICNSLIYGNFPLPIDNRKVSRSHYSRSPHHIA